MSNIQKLVKQMQNSPQNVKFSDLCRVCDEYFGTCRQQSGSHRIYKTPWTGDPRVNIQNDKGKAKVYQVKQVLRPIDRILNKNATE